MVDNTGLATVPRSVLGEAMHDGNKYTLGKTEGSHSLITLSHQGDILHVVSFFHGITPSMLAAAKAIARSKNRTLGSLGMEWIKAVAVALGATVSRVGLQDAWEGPKGINSGDLKSAAGRLLETEALERRMKRVLGDDADDAGARNAYLERVLTGGFYGQFNFDRNRTAEPDKIMVLKAAM
jgi:hypothetical protein